MKVTITVEILDDINTLSDYNDFGLSKEEIAKQYGEMFKNFANIVTDNANLLETRVNVEVTDVRDWDEKSKNNEVKHMKVFLSHAMSGLDESEVINIRNKATDFLNKHYENIEIIDNYHHNDAPINAGRLWHLGTSIRQLEEADAIFFCDDSNSNGCMVESLIAALYDLRVLNVEVGSIVYPGSSADHSNDIVNLPYILRYTETDDGSSQQLSINFNEDFHYDENGKMLI